MASSLPLYAKVRNDLRSRINAGEFASGQLLPAEPELQAEYKVSRITLRRAVGELAKAGYVSKAPGRGTFVTRSPYDATLMSLRGFGTETHKFADTPRRRVLEKSTAAASAEVAERLEISQGEEVVGLRRLLLDGDSVIAYDLTHYPSALVPGFLDHVDDDVSTFRVLEEVYGYGRTSSTGTISAQVASVTEAELLGVSPGEPLIVIRKVIRSEGRTPIALSDFMVDPYRVHIQFDAD